jgi:hypothetical protein
MKWSRKSKWISTDAWRGYEQPIYAVAGSSDTGTWSDSPAPSGEVNKELSRLANYLRKKGFNVRKYTVRSSNAFMIKRWLIVPIEQFDRAKVEANKWLEEHKGDTLHIHDAD